MHKIIKMTKTKSRDNTLALWEYYIIFSWITIFLYAICAIATLVWFIYNTHSMDIDIYEKVQLWTFLLCPVPGTFSWLTLMYLNSTNAIIAIVYNVIGMFFTFNMIYASPPNNMVDYDDRRNYLWKVEKEHTTDSYYYVRSVRKVNVVRFFSVLLVIYAVLAPFLVINSAYTREYGKCVHDVADYVIPKDNSTRINMIIYTNSRQSEYFCNFLILGIFHPIHKRVIFDRYRMFIRDNRSGISCTSYDIDQLERFLLATSLMNWIAILLLIIGIMATFFRSNYDKEKMKININIKEKMKINIKDTICTAV